MSLIAQNISLWGEDIPWLSALREKGRASFLRQGLPNNKNEAWKYSFFAETILQNPQIDTAEHHCDGNCDSDKRSNDVLEIHICNGKVAVENFSAPRGLTIKTLIEAIYDNDIKTYLGKSFDMEKFPFAALNTAYLEQGIFILCERDCRILQPVYLHYHQHAGFNRFCNIRNVFVLEKGAQLTIVEDFTADDAARYFHNQVNEIYVGRNACCQHYVRQTEIAASRHVRFNSVQVKENGKYDSFYAQQECALNRHETIVQLMQHKAEAEIDGIYQVMRDGLSDITTNINHLAPETFSTQVIKGVVGGHAKGVFQGKIHIAKDAQQTSGKQLHKALLLSDDGEVDCKPELEIYADDVQCSHGATCGDLDAEQLFYMQSRGIPLVKARQILIRAYFEEMLLKIADTRIRQWFADKFLS